MLPYWPNPLRRSSSHHKIPAFSASPISSIIYSQLFHSAGLKRWSCFRRHGPSLIGHLASVDVKHQESKSTMCVVLPKCSCRNTVTHRWMCSLIFSSVYRLQAWTYIYWQYRECITTVQACPGFKTFIPNFRPSEIFCFCFLFVFSRPARSTRFYDTQLDYKIRHIFMRHAFLHRIYILDD